MHVRLFDRTHYAVLYLQVPEVALYTQQDDLGCAIRTPTLGWLERGMLIHMPHLSSTGVVQNHLVALQAKARLGLPVMIFFPVQHELPLSRKPPCATLSVELSHYLARWRLSCN